MGDFYITWGIIIYYGGFLHNMGDYYILLGILHNMGDCYIINERFLIRMLNLYLYSIGSL